MNLEVRFMIFYNDNDSMIIFKGNLSKLTVTNT